jgi:taurine dehydrogenase large subunit
MTEAEIEESNFVTTDSISDTRKFLNYFRRLPDGRVMLGSRGPIRESGSAPHRDRLLQIIRRKFPALHSISADYFWGGWVALTPDYMPHVGYAEDDPTAFYAMGYCGSGVSAANQAGRRLAEYLGESKPVPVQLNAQPPRYPLAQFRRVGQVAAFQWYSLRDALT